LMIGGGSDDADGLLVGMRGCGGRDRGDHRRGRDEEGAQELMATKKPAAKPKAKASTKKPERAKVKRTASGALAASARKKSATITKKNGKPGFPMPDKQHARLALADLPKAKGLTSSEKAKVRSRAHAILGSGKSK